MIKQLVTCLFLLVNTYIFSQNFISQTIKGRVIDSESGQSLEGVSIKILDQALGTNTNKEGYFSLEKVPVGRLAIQISLVGYNTQTLTELLLTSGKQLEINIKLEESIKQLAEVKILATKAGASGNDMATVSARSFSVEQTKRYPASWNDPARMATSYAGVTASDDQSNEIIIRGNSPKGLLWRLNGMEIPSPNHFTSLGASGGGISAISINVLGNSDFYTGAFPAEYGNASSGVFNLQLRNGNNTKSEKSIILGFQGLEASAEGPFSAKSKASYLVNYRYSTLGLITKMGLLDLGGAKPNFSDLAFQINIPSQKWAFKLWGLGGISYDDNNNLPTYLPKNGSDFGILGFNSVWFTTKKSFWENNISYSASETNNNRITSVRNYKYGTTRIASTFNTKINASHSTRFGIIHSNINYNLTDLRYITTKEKTITNKLLNDKNTSYYNQAFAQWKWKPVQELQIIAGIHGIILGLNNQKSIEPRLGLGYQISQKWKITAGAGLHSRIEPLTSYLSSKTTKIENNDTLYIKDNLNLPIPKAKHIVIGIELRPSNYWRMWVEAYAQKQYDNFIANAVYNATATPNFASTINSLNEEGSNLTTKYKTGGLGKSKGLEITIERFLNKGIYFINTISLNQSRTNALDGKWHIGRFNLPFAYNIIYGKEWKVGKNKNNLLNINGRISINSGIRNLRVNLPESIKAKTYRPDYANLYNKPLGTYKKVDFKISYTKNKPKTASTFSLDISNLTNAKNPLEETFDIKNNTILTYYQLPLIPLFNYQFQF